MRLSIVVPCFSEEATLPELHHRATCAAENIVGQDFELVLVNDGSRDRYIESKRGRQREQVFAACRPRYPTASAREALTAVTLCEPFADCSGTIGTDLIRAGALPTQDCVSRWNNAHRAGAAGSDGPPCRTGAAAADASNKVSWRVRATQQLACSGDTGAREGLRAQAAK